MIVKSHGVFLHDLSLAARATVFRDIGGRIARAGIDFLFADDGKTLDLEINAVHLFSFFSVSSGRRELFYIIIKMELKVMDDDRDGSVTRCQ